MNEAAASSPRTPPQGHGRGRGGGGGREGGERRGRGRGRGSGGSGSGRSNERGRGRRGTSESSRGGVERGSERVVGGRGAERGDMQRRRGGGCIGGGGEVGGGDCGGKARRRRRKGGGDDVRGRGSGHRETEPAPASGKVLLLHGNRQTGELLLGRIEKLRRFLSSSGSSDLEFVAPDAPHAFVRERDGEDEGGDSDCDKDNVDYGARWMRTWWHRNGDSYDGLEESLEMLRDLWASDSGGFVAVMGFSQGSRLAHLISVLHCATDGRAFPGLRCVIHSSGYGDVPLPTNFPPASTAMANISLPSFPSFDWNAKLLLRSLHVMGESDRLIPTSSSRALADAYDEPVVHIHPGGHHVPMKVGDVRIFGEFFAEAIAQGGIDISGGGLPSSSGDGANNDVAEDCCSGAEAKEEKRPLASRFSSKPLFGVDKKSKDDLPLKEKVTPPFVSLVSSPPSRPLASAQPPDEEHVQTQTDEVSALAQIFPNEFNPISKSTVLDGCDPDEYDSESRTYEHPICYSIDIRPVDAANEGEGAARLWPKRSVALRVEYPRNYPDLPPAFSLVHDMNVFELNSGQSRALLDVARKAADEEDGMPCVMGVLFAARAFFEEGGFASLSNKSAAGVDGVADTGAVEGSGAARASEIISPMTEKDASASSYLRPSSTERISECNQQGLDIARALLGRDYQHVNDNGGEINLSGDKPSPGVGGGKGGSWKYTIGLVGKPSAGKSTFFNAATAFARQRGASRKATAGTDGSDGDDDVVVGGAAMAPHPFTTIDPNVGYCLIPAPDGSCPEDDDDGGEARRMLSSIDLVLGSTHGRDSQGRRFLPVYLKDVAGLVPGAYQGRGKGNKFLDDLTDSDVLIHVVDASGSSDAEGNIVIGNDGDEGGTDCQASSPKNHPLDDLAWVRNELVEWVYFNLASKWDNIVRRGRKKLVEMFSGYKQSQAFVLDVVLAVEEHVYDIEGRDHTLDRLDEWDEADLHRLVSAFLGARFPMALALNKCDLPSAARHIADIVSKLPIFGAHAGTALCAHSEMKFVRHYIGSSVAASDTKKPFRPTKSVEKYSAPNGVWNCLQSAMTLREPVLVFPVNDMQSYQPLPGMTNYAIRDPSLPNKGMISCLGCAPSCWDAQNEIYVANTTKNGANRTTLRDVVIMKPGSNVEDVFICLKWLGAIEGEFVRAEGASKIGDKPKLVSKSDAVGRHNRILRIMTTKRKEWQKK